MIGTGLDVDTPEGVSFSYELASIVDRGKAYFIDLLIRVGIMFVIGVVFVFALGAAIAAAFGLWMIIYFVVEWGYYVVLETVWDGQSPGRKLFNLRVVKSAGHPIGFLDSLLRNLLRTADQLPFTYAVGVLSMMMTRRFQRLGDLAADTIVVREQRAWYGVREPKADLSAVTTQASRVTLSNRERRLLSEFVARKDRLHPERVEQLAAILAAPYAERFGLPMPERPSELLVDLHAGATQAAAGGGRGGASGGAGGAR